MQKPLYFTNKGQLIAGTLHLPPGRKSCPGAVLCHGFTGQKAEIHFTLVTLSRRLAEEGIASLRFDCRGSGESEGQFEDMTPLEEVSDARAALSQLRAVKRVDSRRLGIMGWSLGGLVASVTAGLEPKLKSVALWAPVARPVSVFVRNRPKGSVAMLRKYGRIDIGGLYVGRAFWEVARSVDPPASIARSKASVFVVHGTEDRAVPFVNSTDLLRAARARGIRAERLAVKGADHVFSSVPWKLAVIEATVNWFKETLS